MTASRSVQVQVDFRAESKIRLLLTLHPTITLEAAILLRLYPDVSAILRATAGTIEGRESRIDKVQYEVLQFDGSDRAQLKFPGSSGHVFTDINAFFKADGSALGNSPSFSYDPETDEVVASTSFYGGVQVAYSAPYKVLAYTPGFEETGGTPDTGYTVRYGMVLAAYRQAVATFSVQAPDSAKSSDFVEVYRLFSKVIADPKGRWEVPPGWPKHSTYPVSNEGPDPENSHDEERPHEVGFINTRGQLDYQTYYATLEKPYIGDLNYRPALTLRKRTSPPNDDYATAFQSIDWNTLTAQLVSRHGTFSE